MSEILSRPHNQSQQKVCLRQHSPASNNAAALERYDNLSSHTRACYTLRASAKQLALYSVCVGDKHALLGFVIDLSAQLSAVYRVRWSGVQSYQNQKQLKHGSLFIPKRSVSTVYGKPQKDVMFTTTHEKLQRLQCSGFAYQFSGPHGICDCNTLQISTELECLSLVKFYKTPNLFNRVIVALFIYVTLHHKT